MPSATKLVDSLARPGGNVTGSSFFSPELHVKQLELLKEVMPQLRQVAFLVNPANPLLEITLPQVELAARALGIEIQTVKVLAPAEFGHAFSRLAERRVEAVMVMSDGMLIGNAAAVAALAIGHRLPAVAEAESVQAGGMIGYGADQLEMFRHAASFIDKIAKGAKPADMPVEQPTKFKMVVNLKTAKALGLEIPPTLLARADEVIE